MAKAVQNIILNGILPLKIELYHKVTAYLVREALYQSAHKCKQSKTFVTIL